MDGANGRLRNFGILTRQAGQTGHVDMCVIDGTDIIGGTYITDGTYVKRWRSVLEETYNIVGTDMSLNDTKVMTSLRNR